MDLRQPRFEWIRLYALPAAAALAFLAAAVWLLDLLPPKQLTFAAGETTKTFSVNVYGTSTSTSDEAFWVLLGNANIAMKRGYALGTLKYGG